MRRLSKMRGIRRDRGATAVVAALVVTFIAMPAMALSVDMGNIMFERRQLQNGSDATSMALAQMCANDVTTCNATTSVTSLNALASANAIDNASQLNTAIGTNGQCARPPTGVTFTGMPACASSTATAAQKTAALNNLGLCPPLSDYFVSGAGKDLGYVETSVQTKSSATDNTILPSIFSQALTGGARDTACARAAWGPGGPSSLTVLPLAMSECDWAAQVGYPSATNYPPGPSGTWPGYSNTDARPDWPASENTIYSKGNDTTCDTSSPGGTAPGGFAWLDGLLSACTGAVSDSAWIHGNTGADGCDASVFDPLRGTVIYVPVFDCMAASNLAREPISTDNCNAGSGNNTWYHISGFAAFYLSGWRLTKGDQVSIRPPNALCGSSNSQRCLSGWFLKDLIPTGDFVPPTPTNPNYGVTIVKPAG
ncbi:hypothetical protein ASE25_15475 [Terrabacter sp. Root85]|nr:hypothetical protein ASE25_15475 [Terrabacter sp. Root85]